MGRFGKVCKLTAFKPFASAADALVQINAISESTLTPELKTFLETNLAKVRPGCLPTSPNVCCWCLVAGSCRTGDAAAHHTKAPIYAGTHMKLCLPALPACVQSKDVKKAKYKLGVGEPKLGSEIQSTTNIPCVSNEMVGEVLRGVRAHFTRFIDGLKDQELKQAQLGLAHSYSRAKVKFNVNKVDNMIIQAIALLDTLDKDINTFVMRVREW